jgi:hypothetical protein
MAADQDWRLRVDIKDPSAFHARLRGAQHFERELEPLIAGDVVLSHDDDTLFAYAATQAQIDEVRRAVEHQLGADGLTAAVTVSHWSDVAGSWLAPGEEPPSAPSADAPAEPDPIVTQTFVESSGRLARNFVETQVAEEARARGVRLSIVEHPHLLTTQLAFTLQGPAGAVAEVIAASRSDAVALTRTELHNMLPLPLP